MSYNRFLLVRAASCFSGRLSRTVTACSPTAVLNYQINPVASRLICGFGVPPFGFKSLKFSDNIIVTNSFLNSDLKVWDAVSGKFLRTIEVNRDFGEIVVSGTNVISGKSQKVLKIWDTNTGECSQVFEHEKEVRFLDVLGNKIISGNLNGDFRIWDSDTGKCLHVLAGNNIPASDVKCDGNTVVGCYRSFRKSEIKIWSLEKNECLQTFEFTPGCAVLEYDGGYVVRGFEDGRILVWDSKSGTCVHTLMGHNNSITCLKLRDNNLLSRCDGKLNVWDIVSGQCLLSVNTRKICDDFRTLVNKNFVMRLFGKSLHLWKIKTDTLTSHYLNLPAEIKIFDMKLSNNILKIGYGTCYWKKFEEKVKILDFHV